MSDGKQLESLVAFVEREMLPEGFSVETNRVVYDEDGVQIAEFDVEIRGRLGTTDIAWLIECRDRPGSGAAPVSWIEQLFGRRSRFGFNKVTAVSTSGFSKGAHDYARREGIELRVVEAITPDAFSWINIPGISFFEQRAGLRSALLILKEGSPDDIRDELKKLVLKSGGEDRILRSTMSGNKHTAAEAFLGAVTQINGFDGVVPNGPAKQIGIQVSYPSDDDHFVVDTCLGPARIEAINFDGELTISERLVPVNLTAKYLSVDAGELISQVAAFAPQDIGGIQVALEFHRMGEDGETYVALRRVDKKD